MIKNIRQYIRNLATGLIKMINPVASYSNGPLFKTFDLDMGEKVEFRFSGGANHVLQVLNIEFSTDDLTGAVRETMVAVIQY